uniref:Uncharacterized protein n=1 Tax=Trichobilharzia regenti TaxID=157069 RepID=A0AA85JW97_TRIRE|nr:unnamed protein product [Trichobilharzia regenti]
MRLCGKYGIRSKENPNIKNAVESPPPPISSSISTCGCVCGESVSDKTCQPTLNQNEQFPIPDARDLPQTSSTHSWHKSMKKRIHRSVGCFGFKRPPLSNTTFHHEKVEWGNGTIPDYNSECQKLVKTQQAPIFPNNQLWNDKSYSFSTATSSANKHGVDQSGTVEYTASDEITTGGKTTGLPEYNYNKTCRQRSTDIFSASVNYAFSRPKSCLKNSVDVQRPLEHYEQEKIVNPAVDSNAKLAKIGNQLDGKPDNKPNFQCNNIESSSSSDAFNKDIYQYSSASSIQYSKESAPVVINRCSEEKVVPESSCPNISSSIRQLQHINRTSVKSVNLESAINPYHPVAPVSPDIGNPAYFYIANEHRELLQDVQATKIILLHLKRLLIETPVPETDGLSSTIPLKKYDFKDVSSYSCSHNDNQFLLSSDGQSLLLSSSSIYTKPPVNRTGLEELIEGLAQLSHKNSEVLCCR